MTTKRIGAEKPFVLIFVLIGTTFVKETFFRGNQTITWKNGNLKIIFRITWLEMGGGFTQKKK